MSEKHVNRLTHFSASSDHVCGLVGSLVTLQYISKLTADSMLDFFTYANNFRLDGHMSTKHGRIMEADISRDMII